MDQEALSFINSDSRAVTDSLPTEETQIESYNIPCFQNIRLILLYLAEYDVLNARLIIYHPCHCPLLGTVLLCFKINEYHDAILLGLFKTGQWISKGQGTLS